MTLLFQWNQQNAQITESYQAMQVDDDSDEKAKKSKKDKEAKKESKDDNNETADGGKDLERQVFIGRLPKAGITSQELEKALKGALKGIAKNITVVVNKNSGKPKVLLLIIMIINGSIRYCLDLKLM